jgi:hypothetical protein
VKEGNNKKKKEGKGKEGRQELKKSPAMESTPPSMTISVHISS